MPTFSPNSLLAARFRNARPVHELITIIDAALPVALLTAEVLAQDSKRLPLMNEFVLRLVDHNMTSVNRISGTLGLPKTMVDQTVASLFRTDDLMWGPPTDDETRTPGLRLTAKGRITAREAADIVPVRVSQPLVLDQMLWKAVPYDRRITLQRGQAEEDGMIMLPAARSGRVDDGDITALLRENGTTDREVLQVKSIHQTKARRVLPVKLLVYADQDRADIQLGVAVDGELSQTHELALIGHGGAQALGITVAPPPERPALDPELERTVSPCRRSPSTAPSRQPRSSPPRPPSRPCRQTKPTGRWRTRSVPSASSSTRRSSTRPSPMPGAVS
ncbi:hypothetical protein ACH4OW_33670 [Streptomyces sp. NPDC017056]|uniref:hypothetical protein n=1 Tax=Streptomyces sp. NPDC017056 TaxID=3364973 RepID=UPI0037887241